MVVITIITAYKIMNSTGALEACRGRAGAEVFKGVSEIVKLPCLSI